MQWPSFSFIALSSGAFAADCLLSQARQGAQPTSNQITKAVSSDIAAACADNPNLQSSFSHANIIFSVERVDNTKPLSYCKDAFQNIIDQCITNGNYWGGTWSLNGETYHLSNNVYPANALASTDDGGPAPISSKGPITTGPQTRTESGPFATNTVSINGLTANSVTTTSADGHPTILPIWLKSPGIGIILVPGPGVIPGGIIPPPPGLPPLTIGPDGQASEEENQKTTTTTCTTCSTCAGFDILSDDATSILANDGDPDLPTIAPNIWAAMETKYPLAATTTSSSSGTPTQSAVPIDEPACMDANDDVKNDLPRWASKGNAIRFGDGSYHSVNDILYMLRQVVCDGTCTAPAAVGSQYVAVYQKGGQCEVSVAVSSKIEIYVNRDTWPENNNDYNTIWQECWDSTANMIDKCVSDQAKQSWWNGDHVYQFYAAGLRSLNDPYSHHAQNGLSLGTYLMPSTEGLSCINDCHGFVPNPDWCNKNCGGVNLRRRNRSLSLVLLSRSTENVAQVGNCALPYQLPDYPSAGEAATLPGVQKYYDRDDSISGNNNCNNPRLAGPVPAVRNSLYNTEHVFEKHIIKRFLYFLIGGQQAFDQSLDPNEHDPVATCADIQAVFGTLNPQSTHFNTQTAAQLLATAVSCKGSGCPDNNRVGEFFLLRKEINGMKNRIFAGYYTGIGADQNSNKLPSCDPTTQSAAKMQQQMIDAALVFQYMNKQEVFDAFNAVHLRIRGILAILDADTLGRNLPPRNLRAFVSGNTPNTWLAAYDEFMERFLVDTERKMGLWLHDCKAKYDVKAQTDAEKQLVTAYSSGDGVYADGALKLSGIWSSIRGNEAS